MIGARLYYRQRPLTITGVYEGYGDDPSGYYYKFDDEPAVTHWISTGALNLRFTKKPATTVPCDRNGCNVAKRVDGTADHRCGSCGELI